MQGMKDMDSVQIVQFQRPYSQKTNDWEEQLVEKSEFLRPI